MAGALPTYLISWTQTQLDATPNAPVMAADCGALWTWHGEPVRIDDAYGSSRHQPGESQKARLIRAAAGARRIVARALAGSCQTAPAFDDFSCADRSFVISDGHRRWTATLIELPNSPQTLLMFLGAMPQPDTPLIVSKGISAPYQNMENSTSGEGVVCFTPGTLLETPSGLRPVETLAAGDILVTKDNGAQPIVWVGSRNVSGARLVATPDLRPVRIVEGALGNGHPNGNLTVSPDHKVLVTGRAARANWGEEEVLVAARDLVDGIGIHRDLQARSAIYYHLMLERHQVLVANGIETESFHPAAAALDDIDEDQRLRLYDVMPELAKDPASYGPTSRRTVSGAEASLLPSAA